MKKIFLATILSLLTNSATPVLAADSIRYDFDSVDVQYAAEFVAYPKNVDQDNWIVQIAGRTNKPVLVLYGVVTLKKNGQADFTEEFIKARGEGGGERFLLNSTSAEPDEIGHYKTMKSFFWSAKRLASNTIVKDFTSPIKSISVTRNFTNAQNLKSVTLSFSNDGQKANDEFWTVTPKQNVYEGDMNSLRQVGEAGAFVVQK